VEDAQEDSGDAGWIIQSEKKGFKAAVNFAARHEVNSNTSEQNWKIGRHPGLQAG
jgi:hypothetical protein